MGLVDDLKKEYGMDSLTERQPRQKVRTVVRYVRQPVYVYAQPQKRQKTRTIVRYAKRPQSWGSKLNEAKQKKAYKQFRREERAETIGKIKSGFGSVASGAKSVGGFVKQRSNAVKRVGLGGLFGKKSIYD